jgi:hypothetical protein
MSVMKPETPAERRHRIATAPQPAADVLVEWLEEPFQRPVAKKTSTSKVRAEKRAAKNGAR